ncbi:MAG: MinD/ParA family ATP-binding protein [bacterium]
MDKKPKLGRGLEEVSHFYLSTAHKNDYTGEKQIEEHRHIISIHHSGSDITQSFLLSNLALELAKYQVPIYIIDFCDNQRVNIRSTVKRLIKGQESSPEYSVQLYGLPAIRIVEAYNNTHESLEDLIKALHINSKNCFIFLNKYDKEGTIALYSQAREVIILSKTDKISLLQAYAHIKAILEKGKESTIYMILDEIREEGEAETIFQRFALYVKKKFSHAVYYLGGLVHDEHIGRSIEEGRPIVLSQDQSIAKDNILSISKNFFTLSKNSSNQII